MITLDIPQNTEEWHKARLSIPTASMMSCIITAGGKASTQADTYMNQLLADWVAGYPVDHWEGNKFTEMGHEREPESIALYELITGSKVNQVGFVFRNEDRLVGCSPDGLVDELGLAEFKNPKGSTMISYLLGGKVPTTYVPQVQAQLWITGREWCDFMFQHPDLTHRIIRVERDEKYITLMSGMVSKFLEKMLAKREQLKQYKR